MTLSAVDLLQRMLDGAYKCVNRQKEQINEINIFPVPDQDTGDNLNRTLQGMHAAIIAHRFKNSIDLRTAAIDGALTSASGNVGIIVTSFLNGFLTTFDSQTLSPAELVEAFTNGAKAARDSIQNPKPGTILDVASATAEELKHHTFASIEDVLKAAQTTAATALKATQQNMDLYRQAAVVDAGGFGFTLMIEGMADGLTKHAPLHIQADQPLRKSKRFFQIISHRFEVVSLLTKPRLSKKAIIKTLVPFGDCLDVVEANQKMKIHIHTDLPDEVVSVITGFGTILQMKTADMTESATNPSRQPIGIIADEGASLDPAYVIDHDIVVVPYITAWEKVDERPEYQEYSIYQKMRLLRDRVDEFGWPKTSQPPQKAFYRAFKEQLEKYDTVICFTFASTLSGAYNSAVQGRALLPPEDRNRVFIPDYNQASSSEAVLAIIAQDLIDTGYTIRQIETQLNTLATRTDFIGAPDDISWVMKGGRVTGFKAQLFQWLRKFPLHPIFGIDKHGLKLQRVIWGKQTVGEAVVTYIRQRYPVTAGEYDIVIEDADDRSMRQCIVAGLHHPHYHIRMTATLAPVLGIHSGPTSIACGVCRHL